jgi:protein required for attachment to host cells
MRGPKTLFVIADGARARLVRRVPGAARFATFEEIDDGGALRRAQVRARGAPHAAVMQSATPQRHSIGRGEDDRRIKAAFALKVAGRAAAIAQEQGYDQIVVAAPPRLAGILRRRLGPNAVVAAALTRDLTKAPDSALGRWFLDLPLPSRSAWSTPPSGETR